MNQEQLQEPLLRNLIEAHAISRIIIRGGENGFRIAAAISNGEKVLATAKGYPRLFATLDTAGSYLARLGFPQFEVDMSEFQPGRLRAARPDRAEAMRLTRTKMQQPTLI
jgi:hypothetical protein